jgi:hypothetical protein
LTYYEEDQPTEQEWRDKIVRSLDKDLIPEGMEHIKASVEQIDPGESHKELMEMLGAIFVQLSRIYDVLITDSPAGDALDAQHSKGRLFASAPILLEEAWNDQKDQDQKE